MVISLSNVLLISSVLIIISVLAQKLSFRVGVPALVIFLVVGMLAGIDGVLGIDFQNYEIAEFIGVLALNFILFNGGLEINWREVKPIVWQGVSLSTLGVVLTALTLGLFIWLLTGMTLYEGLLLGSIVSSTDAAAVFSILRMQNIGLKDRLKPTLELESGSNDPMAYLLVIGFIGLVQNPDESLLTLAPLFLQQVVIGVAVAVGLTWAARWIFNHVHLKYQGLYPVFMIGVIFFIYSAANLLGGNGFLAVFLSGVMMGNLSLAGKRMILIVFDGFAWLMQIVLFITLGLLVNPSEIPQVWVMGLVVSLFLIFVARPIAVLLSLLFFKMNIKRRLYIIWGGLRGAAPIVFATFPFVAGLENAGIMFNIVFFVSITSVLIQGSTLPIVARWLNLTSPIQEKRLSPIEVLMEEGPSSFLREIIIPPGSSCVGKHLFELNFPEKTQISMISRDGKFIIPTGRTTLEAGDLVVVLYEKEELLTEVYQKLGISKSYNETVRSGF